MPGFLEIASTPSVVDAQTANGSGELMAAIRGRSPFSGLGAAEIAFIRARDSFYLATVSETGWPYVQHRGGPPGFLKVLDARTLGFADLRGNRQYISLGNLTANDRAALILVDYAARRRLKLYARVSVRQRSKDDDAAGVLVTPDVRGRVERLFVLRVEAYDWNCPQHITPRFSLDELEPALQRLERLEAENKALKQALTESAPA